MLVRIQLFYYKPKSATESSTRLYSCPGMLQTQRGLPHATLYSAWEPCKLKHLISRVASLLTLWFPGNPRKTVLICQCLHTLSVQLHQALTFRQLLCVFVLSSVQFVLYVSTYLSNCKEHKYVKNYILKIPSYPGVATCNLQNTLISISFLAYDNSWR